jgi:hypothetical protein
LFVDRFLTANPTAFPNPEEALTQAVALLLVNGFSQRVTVAPAPGDSATPTSDQLEALARDPLTLSPRPPKWVARCIPVMRGWLKSQMGGIMHTKLFHVIIGHQLYWFQDNRPRNEDQPLGKLDISDVQVVFGQKSHTKFAVVHPEALRMICFAKGPEPVKGVKKLEFTATSRAVRDEWICVLQRMITLAPFLSDEELAPTFEDE